MPRLPAGGIRAAARAGLVLALSIPGAPAAEPPPEVEIPGPAQPEAPRPGAEAPARPAQPASAIPAVSTRQVDEAIAKGVEWLKRKQLPDGSFGATGPGPAYGGKPNEKVAVYHNQPGIAALCLHALLKSDVPPKDPAVVKGFQFLNAYIANKTHQISTYDLGVSLMAIEAMYEALVKDRLAQQGKQVLERPGDFKEPRYTPSARDQQFCQEIVTWLYRNQTRDGGWRYGDRFKVVGSPEDISATQIVMLGLKSAGRMKLSVNTAVVRRTLGFVMRSQEPDGPKVQRRPDAKPGDRFTYASMGEDRARGWAYEKASEIPGELAVTGSMTTAGITTLLICKSLLASQLTKKESAEIDQCVWDGFAWLAQHWSVVQNPGGTRGHILYYLYGIERVGTLGLYTKIVSHDWYAEGSAVLVRIQRADGSWETQTEVPPCDVIETCLALLFLRRSTVPIGDVLTPRVATPE
jgi:hypothetical protein